MQQPYQINDRVPDRSDPIRQLIDEHEIFMEALRELAGTMKSVPVPSNTLPAGVFNLVERIWHAVNEHLNVHFVKEEEIFFPYIEKYIPGGRVKFQFLHVDHDRLRECFECFTESLQEYRTIGPSAVRVASIRMMADEMIRWFYYHIIAEDAVYFDIAGQILSAEESNELLIRMRSVEARLREQIEPLLEDSQRATSRPHESSDRG